MQPRTWVIAVAGAVGLLLGDVTCQGIREDELRCEEAAAHLLDCCPGFDAERVTCYNAEGCNGHVYPQIGVSESKDITALSCSQVRDAGYCEAYQ